MSQLSRRGTAAVTLLLLVVAACGKTQANRRAAEAPKGFTVDLQWLEGPKVEDYSKAQLTFLRRDGVAPGNVDGVGFTPMMPTMNHSSFLDDQLIERQADRTDIFVVSGIYFTMPGRGDDRWVIHVRATVDGEAGEVEIPTDVP